MSFTYAWANPEETVLKRVDAEGNIAFVPNDPLNTDYSKFLASGAIAADYVAPPEPKPLTTEEKVNRLLSDYGLTRDELRAVLDS